MAIWNAFAKPDQRTSTGMVVNLGGGPRGLGQQVGGNVRGPGGSKGITASMWDQLAQEEKDKKNLAIAQSVAGGVGGVSSDLFNDSAYMGANVLAGSAAAPEMNPYTGGMAQGTTGFVGEVTPTASYGEVASPIEATSIPGYVGPTYDANGVMTSPGGTDTLASTQDTGSTNPLYSDSTAGIGEPPTIDSVSQAEEYIKENRPGYDALLNYALDPNASPWLRLQLEQQRQGEKDILNRTAQTAASAQAQAASDLAMRGGLAGGARERIARGGVWDRISSQQGARQQGLEERLGLMGKEQASKIASLGQLAGQEGGYAGTMANLINSAQSAGIDIWKTLGEWEQNEALRKEFANFSEYLASQMPSA